MKMPPSKNVLLGHEPLPVLLGDDNVTRLMGAPIEEESVYHSKKKKLNTKYIEDAAAFKKLCVQYMCSF